MRSITQIAGRAARQHSNGNVILYADHCTDSMRYAIEQSNRLRKTDALQHGHEMLPPTGAEKRLGTEHPAGKYGSDTRHGWNSLPSARQPADAGPPDVTSAYSTESIDTQIARAREEMERAAKSLDFPGQLPNSATHVRSTKAERSPGTNGSAKMRHKI